MWPAEQSRSKAAAQAAVRPAFSQLQAPPQTCRGAINWPLASLRHEKCNRFRPPAPRKGGCIMWSSWSTATSLCNPLPNRTDPTASMFNVISWLRQLITSRTSVAAWLLSAFFAKKQANEETSIFYIIDSKLRPRSVFLFSGCFVFVFSFNVCLFGSNVKTFPIFLQSREYSGRLSPPPPASKVHNTVTTQAAGWCRQAPTWSLASWDRGELGRGMCHQASNQIPQGRKVKLQALKMSDRSFQGKIIRFGEMSSLFKSTVGLFLFSGLKKMYLTKDECHSVPFLVRLRYLYEYHYFFSTLYGKKNHVNSYILNTVIWVFKKNPNINILLTYNHVSNNKHLDFWKSVLTDIYS